jgi:hypothetical protein
MMVGGYFFLLPIYLYLWARKEKFQINYLWPIIFIVIYFLLIIYAPAGSNGDISEYRHRSFPLIYSIFGCFFWIYMYDTLPESNLLRKYSIPGVIFLIPVLVVFYRDSNPAKPLTKVMPWSAAYHNETIEAGLIEAAKFLQLNSFKGDCFAVSINNSNNINNPGLKIISLSGVPAFMLRQPSHVTNGTKDFRRGVINDIQNASNWDEARKIMRQNNIRWFISIGPKSNDWDLESKDYEKFYEKIKIFDSAK